MKAILLFLFLVICSHPIFGQKKLPIIEMQLHAHPVEGQGPPPVAICTPKFEPHEAVWFGTW